MIPVRSVAVFYDTGWSGSCRITRIRGDLWQSCSPTLHAKQSQRRQPKQQVICEELT